MGILDQLRDEAEHKKSHQSIRKSREKQLENDYQKKVLPRMQHAFSYLKEVVAHLNFVDTKIEIEQYCHRYPQFGLLTQHSYKINTDGYGGYADFDRLMEINITFFLMGGGAFSYQVAGKNRIEQEISSLHTRNIKFDWQHQTSKVHDRFAVFTITRKIPVRFRFEVDYENSQIKLIINNHEDLKTYQKCFAPEKINEALLDEISRYLLRKDSDFILLEISNQHKQQIKEKLAEVHLEQAQIIKQMRFEEEQQVKESSNKLSDRVKSLMGSNKKT